MTARLLNFLTALSLVLSAAGLPGCAPAGRRPVVREEGLVLSVLSFPPGRREIVLPLTQDGPLPLTDAVAVNGRTVGWFIVDTGAGWTFLDREAAKRLGVTAAAPWKNWSTDGKPDGFYRIDRLGIGGMTLSNHVIGVADLSSLAAGRGLPIVGALGGDVLGTVPFTIDFREKQLVLHRREAFRPPHDADEHRLTVQRPVTTGSYVTANPCAGSPKVAAKVDGVRTSLMLDTGSGSTLLLLPKFTKAHPRFVSPTARTAARVVGAAGARGLAGRELVRADVGRVEALGARFFCAGTAMAVRPGTATGGRDAGILGAPFLEYGRLTFDYCAGRIWVKWRRPAPQTTRES